jgi:hypothetical protein
MLMRKCIDVTDLFCHVRKVDAYLIRLYAPEEYRLAMNAVKSVREHIYFKEDIWNILIGLK